MGTVRDPDTQATASLLETGGQGGQQRAFRATGEGHSTAHQDVAWSALPVGALWHGRLLARVIGLLHRGLEDHPSYALFASGTRVKVRATGRLTRPDVAVVCGPVEADPDDPDALVNPTLLVDVAPAGCGEDTTWEHCQRIASLRGYLRVACRSPRLELYARAGTPASGSTRRRWAETGWCCPSSRRPWPWTTCTLT